MDGDIGVESTPGGGSRFHFTVTLPAPASAVPARRPLVAEPAGVKVLVVDDNATNRAIVDNYLRGAGAFPAAATGGAEALAVMHAAAREGEPFDVEVLDAQMPEMDGLDLAAAIRQAPPLRPARPVVLSA